MKQPTVVVNGFAERTVAPDRFVMNAGISVRAADSAAAHAGLAQRFATLDQAVMALGTDDITVERSGIHSYGEGGRNRRWVAGRTLSVTCTDTARAAEVAGAFERIADLQLDGPHWLVDRGNPARADAQGAAVQDARERAERYAAALGGRLGRLVELQDGGGDMPFHAVAFAARSAEHGDGGLETLDLSPQQQTITASVQARWRLALPD
jgi:uncharacterized protein YggE